MPECTSKPDDDFRADARSLSLTALRLKYPDTYNCMKRMKERAKAGKCQIVEGFGDFREYLYHLGPRPGPSYTVDRKDPNNPAYGPGLVQWADKKAQANNRIATIWLERDGVRKPLAAWAEQTGQKPDTMRAHRRQGWCDRDVIAGHKDAYDPSQFGHDPRKFNPWPTLFPGMPDVQVNWNELYWSETKGRLSPVRFAYEEILKRYDERISELKGIDCAGPSFSDEHRAQLESEATDIEPYVRRAAQLYRDFRLAMNRFNNGKRTPNPSSSTTGPRTPSPPDDELLDIYSY